MTGAADEPLPLAGDIKERKIAIAERGAQHGEAAPLFVLEPNSPASWLGARHHEVDLPTTALPGNLFVGQVQVHP